MGERFFNVKEAAEILGCSPRKVYSLLSQGWLKGPVGRPKRDVRALISEKSMFQFKILECLSRFPIRTLRELKSDRNIFATLLCKTAEPNRFSKVEETGVTTDGGSSTSLPKDTERKCLHHDFAAEHQFSFGWMARQLLPNDDLALQDDLVQEMSLAVLEYEKPASCEYLLKLAENRAIDYLRYEALRGTLSLIEARELSDTFEAKMESLGNLIESLIERGVPREWIDEVIGTQREHHGTGGQATSGTRSGELAEAG